LQHLYASANMEVIRFRVVHPPGQPSLRRSSVSTYFV